MFFIYVLSASLPVDKAHLVSNMRRVGYDMRDNWGMLMALVDIYIDRKLWQYGKQGFYNDLGTLEIGNRGMTRNEYTTHMALWSAFKAPLILGNDITKMDDFTLKLLTHREFISINKDALEEPAKLVHSSNVKSGSAFFRVVSRWCNSSNPRQQWKIDKHGVFKNEATSKCMSVNYDGTALVQNCKNGEANQMWIKNGTTKQIHPSR